MRNFLAEWLYNTIPMEGYYLFKKKFKRYFRRIMLPSLFISAIIDVIYMVIIWPRMIYIPIVFFTWLGSFIALIVKGAIYGEDVRERYRDY